MDLRELQRQAHENARAKGFHSVELDEDVVGTLARIKAALGHVTDAVEQLRRHAGGDAVMSLLRRNIMSSRNGITWTPSAPTRRLLLVATEVTEAIRAIGTPEYASELADIVIRVADTAAADGIDLQAAVEAKMQANAARPRMHGGKAF